MLADRVSSLNDYVFLGKSGLRVSRACLGTMTWGDRWGMGAGKEECKAIFDKYVAAGGNFIDCANFYHDGQSEEWLGEFVEAAGNRDDLVIATKYSLPMGSTATGVKYSIDTKSDDAFVGETFRPAVKCGNSRKALLVGVEASLKRLRTTYIDVYYVHYWDYMTSPEEIMRTLSDLVAAGKIMYPALSNVPVWAVAECNTLAASHGWPVVTALQYKHSLLDRSIERDVLHYARNRGHSVVAWDVLGGGKLTGKYRRDADPDTTESARKTAWGTKVAEKDWAVVDTVVEIAREISATPAQVALAWSLHQANVIPLIGARTLAQLEDNMGAFKIRFTEAQLNRLDSASGDEGGYLLNFIGRGLATNPWATKFTGQLVTSDKETPAPQ